MGTMTPNLNCEGMASKFTMGSAEPGLEKRARCCGERESGPAELLRLRRLIAALTSSRKDALGIFSRVASSTSGQHPG